MRIKAGEPGAQFITGVSVNGRKLDMDARPISVIDTEANFVEVVKVDAEGRPLGTMVRDASGSMSLKPEIVRIEGKVDVCWLADFEGGMRRVSAFSGGTHRRHWLDLRVDDSVRDGAHLFNGEGVFIPQEHLEAMSVDDFAKIQYAASHFDSVQKVVQDATSENKIRTSIFSGLFAG